MMGAAVVSLVFGVSQLCAFLLGSYCRANKQKKHKHLRQFLSTALELSVCNFVFMLDCLTQLKPVCKKPIIINTVTDKYIQTQ